MNYIKYYEEYNFPIKEITNILLQYDKKAKFINSQINGMLLIYKFNPSYILNDLKIKLEEFGYTIYSKMNNNSILITKID
jgi:hypothetical protein